MERRRAQRRVPCRDESVARVRLRTGREMTVVDVGPWGMLLDGMVRLLPGTHLDVHVVTRDGRLLVRSRVVRCWVAALRTDAVVYRGALAFDRPVDTAAAGYALPGGTPDGGESQGRDYPMGVGGIIPPGGETLVA